ncbi:hypothetical protein FOA52_009648 [Chlamydomonas sp. UWO 241]|nr:hypothetical protein FOA52_009648 [Chlamydomonas sp. UWO 241]
MVRSTRTVDHACLAVYATADPERAPLVLGQFCAALACGAYDGGSVWRAVLCRALFPGMPPPVLGGGPDLLCVRRTLDPLFTAVAVVLAAVPSAWVEAAAGGAALTLLRPLCRFQPLPRAGERAAVVEILRLVGWQLPIVITPAGWQRGRPGLRSAAAKHAPPDEPRWIGFANGPGVVGKLTCKLAVALQLRVVLDERRLRRAATVEAALALDCGMRGGPRATDAQVCAGLRTLEAAVPGLWRLPLLSACKEPIWRLWVSGFHKQAALGVPECLCGWRCREEDGPPATAWRAHCFWGCAVAEAVVVAVAAALPAPTPVITCCQVWLLQPPAGVRAGVWAVVAALVVDAMERGCRHLWRITRPRDGVLPPDRTVSVERAGALATMALWDALASFAEGGVMPRGWAGVVGPTHPYVGVADGKLTLNKAS